MSFLLALHLEPRDVRQTVAAVTQAERAGADLVTFGDRFAGDGPRLDALAVASYLGPATSQMGLVPTVTTTHTEPFHVATATQTLDLVSRGRCGWLVDVSLDTESAAVIGRRPAPTAEAAWTEALDVVRAVRALWDSWQDDAVIREASTSRFIDRDRLHYVDAVVHGTDAEFSVKGPSIVPRPPQGQPVVAIRLPADVAPDDPRWALVEAEADLVVVTGSDDTALLAGVAEVRSRTAGRDVRVLVAPQGWYADRLAAEVTGWEVDGVQVSDVDHVGPLIAALGRVPEQHATLRERLGLPRPQNRFEAVS